MGERCKGFTLVELSIVLVIIGLLIGGILVAQSMISAARITAQVRQIQQFDIAVTNFKTKFGGLPGDVSITFSGGIAGNNDGIIDASTSTYDFQGVEYGNFWNELSVTGMITDGVIYSNSGSTALTPGSHEPFAKISTKGITSKADLGIIAYGIPATGKNYYDIFTGPCCGGLYSAGRAVLPIDMAALDSKMDDSLPGSGSFVARAINTSPTDISIIAVGNGCLLTTTLYKIANPVNTCVPRIDMLAQ